MRVRLSQGLYATIDPEDEELVSRYGWHAAKTGDGRSCAATTIPMHRLIMDAPMGCT